MNPDIERILDDLFLSSELPEQIGGDWRAALRPLLQDAWNHGYTTGQKDTVDEWAESAIHAAEAVRSYPTGDKTP